MADILDGFELPALVMLPAESAGTRVTGSGFILPVTYQIESGSRIDQVIRVRSTRPRRSFR